MSSSVGAIIPNIWKVIKFHGSKPPTSTSIMKSRSPSLAEQFQSTGIPLGKPPVGRVLHATAYRVKRRFAQKRQPLHLNQAHLQ
jgi:hypothetical protein